MQKANAECIHFKTHGLSWANNIGQEPLDSLCNIVGCIREGVLCCYRAILWDISALKTPLILVGQFRALQEVELLHGTLKGGREKGGGTEEEKEQEGEEGRGERRRRDGRGGGGGDKRSPPCKLTCFGTD